MRKPQAKGNGNALFFFIILIAMTLRENVICVEASVAGSSSAPDPTGHYRVTYFRPEADSSSSGSSQTVASPPPATVVHSNQHPSTAAAANNFEPTWARWIEPEVARRSPSSDVDDSFADLDHCCSASFFHFRKQRVNWYISSNGFLSPATYTMCSHFCYDYVLRADGSLGANWPLIGLFVTDLDPSDVVARNKSSQGIFVHNVSKNTATPHDDDSITVTFMNVPVFGAAKAAAEAPNLFPHNNTNLTAQASVFPNGTIVFRYKSVPAKRSATGERLVGPLVGLLLTKELRVLAEPPRWNENNSLTITAIRFDPAIPPCSSLRTCEACTLHGKERNCVWCDGLSLEETVEAAAFFSSTSQDRNVIRPASKRGMCVGRNTSRDMCGGLQLYDGQCQLPQLATDAHNNVLKSSWYRHRTLIYGQWISTSLNRFENARFGQQVKMPFSFPLFYNPPAAQRSNDEGYPLLENAFTIPSNDFSVEFADSRVKVSALFPSSSKGKESAYILSKLYNKSPRSASNNKTTAGGAVSIRVAGVNNAERDPLCTARCIYPACNPTTQCEQSVIIVWEEARATGRTGGSPFEKNLGIVLTVSGRIILFYKADTATTMSSPVGDLYPDRPFFNIGVSHPGELRDAFGNLILGDVRSSTQWSVVGPNTVVEYTPTRFCTPCFNNGRCNVTTLQCECDPSTNFEGASCSTCKDGFYLTRHLSEGTSSPSSPSSSYQGKVEQELRLETACTPCAMCENGGECDKENGQCKCPFPFSGARCEVRCANDNQQTQQEQSQQEAQEQKSFLCHNCTSTNGYCQCGVCVCLPGWEGPNCSKKAQEAAPLKVLLVSGIVLLLACLLALMAPACRAVWRRANDQYRFLQLRRSNNRAPSALSSTTSSPVLTGSGRRGGGGGRGGGGRGGGHSLLSTAWLHPPTTATEEEEESHDAQQSAAEQEENSGTSANPLNDVFFGGVGTRSGDLRNEFEEMQEMETNNAGESALDASAERTPVVPTSSRGGQSGASSGTSCADSSSTSSRVLSRGNVVDADDEYASL